MRCTKMKRCSKQVERNLVEEEGLGEGEDNEQWLAK